MKRRGNAHIAHRFNEIAREKLAGIMMLEVHDPALAMVTVTACDVSPDRSRCIAYVTCDAERYEEVETALKRATGRIRSHFGKALGWYCTPRLEFRIDPSTDEAERIARALQDVPPTAAVKKDEFGYPIESDEAFEALERTEPDVGTPEEDEL
ncbi:MAG: 30S ribosome-binding factor RbfA [Atopobiaceae bacterium]|nr:30S ribosome-binding factor RbfA [Atopobiaceae bacterium]